MYLGATLLEMQALRKAAENLRVLIFSLVLTPHCLKQLFAVNSK